MSLRQPVFSGKGLFPLLFLFALCNAPFCFMKLPLISLQVVRWLRISLCIGLLLGIVSGAVAQHVVLPPLPISNVGDIAYNSVTDRASFQRCGDYDAPQYYQVQTSYAGGMTALRQRLLEKPVPFSQATGSGYLTIRFLVNCHGQTDRFRVFQVNSTYQPTQFSAVLVAELLRRTRALAGWQPGHYSGQGALHGQLLDSYYHLVFKISHGRIVDILP